MKLIIDRFENEYAVVEMEDGTLQDIPKIFVPQNAKEGSIINITVDETETNHRREEMKSKMNSIFHK